MKAGISKSSLVQGKSAIEVTTKALLGFSALCVICLGLSAPLARATSFSATALGEVTGVNGCGGLISVSGLASVSAGPITCSGVEGNKFSSSASSSGSWVTGDLSAGANDVSGPGSCCLTPSSQINAYLTDVGVLTLPSYSAQATFGVSGVTGIVTKSGLAGGSGFADIQLTVQDLSKGTSKLNTACVATFAGCKGLGVLSPVTLTVYNGDSLALTAVVGVQAGTLFGDAGSASITVDPLYLNLPAGATFDSGITGFLSGSAPTPTPEPSSVLLLGAGLLGLCLLRRQLA